MYKITFIPHKRLSAEILNTIITIKQKAWPYSFETQIEWINKNILLSDIHVILYNDNNPVAYLNLIHIEILLHSQKLEGFGIGNVCSIEKNKGWGTVLLQYVNSYILSKNKFGLLFCKNELISFYSKCNWKLVNCKVYNSKFDNINTKVMALVQSQNFDEITYDGRLF